MKKIAFAVALLIAGGTSAQAFPFFHKHKQQQKKKPAAPAKKALGPTIPPPVDELA